MWNEILSAVTASAAFLGLSAGPVADPPPAPAASASQFQSEAPFSVHDVSPVQLAQKPAGSQADLNKIVAQMQQTYEHTKDFRANFTQKFTNTMLRRTMESTGTVQFRKPGLMRWDYAAPTKKSFIVDDGQLWIHTPEDHTAMVNRCFKQDGLTASISFLWGSGNIAKQFNVSFFSGTFGAKTDHHLLLLPKKANSAFAKVILVLDPKTYRVKQSVVVDTQGNVNQFIYTNLRFNQHLKAKAFTFTPPKGTHVAPIPGTCAAPKAAPKAPKASR